MKQIHFAQIHETLFYDKMENGLDVYVLRKNGFSKTFATFTTKYGSIDRHFLNTHGKEYQVPDGIAHFLEHKMFEKKDGDVFSKFSARGAMANAFTSFQRTAYLFSCSNHVLENLETLIDFVQEPYFSDESVEKEKGIIAQEINMYNDNPEWQAYFSLIRGMYHHHPVKIDIAGTVESIMDITKEHLYLCYETFYHPSNMLLFVVGDIEPQEIIEYVQNNQNKKQFAPQLQPIKRIFPQEPQSVYQKITELYLAVSVPKCYFGYKEKIHPLRGEALLKRELEMAIGLDLLFGASSELYQSLFDRGIIDYSFFGDYTWEEDYAFSTFGGDTEQPEQFLQTLTTEIAQAIATGFAPEAFRRIKNKKIGRFLSSLNSIEYIANNFTRYRFVDSDLFKIIPILESITLEEVETQLKHHFDPEQLTVSFIRVKS